jgi:hypothetical protein
MSVPIIQISSISARKLWNVGVTKTIGGTNNAFRGKLKLSTFRLCCWHVIRYFARPLEHRIAFLLHLLRLCRSPLSSSVDVSGLERAAVSDVIPELISEPDPGE